MKSGTRNEYKMEAKREESERIGTKQGQVKKKMKSGTGNENKQKSE